MTDPCEKLQNMLLEEQADPEIFLPGLKWWMSVNEGEGRLPHRSDFFPEKMSSKTLPHVLLVDIGSTPASMRFRLVGTAHVNFNQKDTTGKTFDDVYCHNASSLPYIMTLYKNLVDTRRPLWSVNELIHSNTNNLLKICRLMLPLTNARNEVDLGMAVQMNLYNDPIQQDSDTLWPKAASTNEKIRILL